MVVPLVIGLRQYVQTLTEVIRIRVGDGTLMGAVKGIIGNQLCALIPCTDGGTGAIASAAPPAPPAPTAPPAVTTPPAAGSDQGDLGDLIRRVLGA
jgi:hypothetical protein